MYNELELDIALESLDEIIDNDISFNTEDAEKVFMECINVLTNENLQQMILKSELYDISKENNISIEGASSEAIGMYDSIEIKEAKAALKKGKSLYDSKKYSEAIKEITKAKETFKRVHKQINDLHSWPVSWALSPLVNTVTGTMRIFDLAGDDALSDKIKAKLVTGQVISALGSIISLLPGVGSIISSIGSIYPLVKNKISGNKEIGDKMGFFNHVQRDILVIIKGYIEACDVMIIECKANMK